MGSCNVTATRVPAATGAATAVECREFAISAAADGHDEMGAWDPRGVEGAAAMEVEDGEMSEFCVHDKVIGSEVAQRSSRKCREGSSTGCIARAATCMAQGWRRRGPRRTLCARPPFQRCVGEHALTKTSMRWTLYSSRPHLKAK